MNSKSIKFRLTFWYSLAFFITNAILFSVFYLVTRQIVFRQTDTSLITHGNKVLEVLARKDNGTSTMLEKQAFLQDFGNIPGMLLVQLNSSGQVLNSSVQSSENDFVYQKFYKQVKNTDAPFLADEMLDGEPLRFWVSPIHDGRGALSGVVLMAHSIGVINQSLETLLAVLVALYVFSLIPAALGGYVLAGRALDPINAISQRLKQISSENLQERVATPQTNDELEELSNTFNNLLDRLQATFDRERQFIGDVAHELKTPLSTLRSSVEISLEKNRSGQEYRRVLGETLIDINQISTTLKNILDLAWSDTDQSQLKGKIYNLSDQVAELKELTSKMAQNKKILVKGSIESGIKIVGKKEKMGRAILNLIDNAIKFTGNGQTVSVNLSHHRGMAIIEIKDAGPGIEQEDLPHIFERFYRGTKTERVAGSGLGLAIVKAIVTAHRGQVRAASQPGHGTTFSIILPLASS